MWAFIEHNATKWLLQIAQKLSTANNFVSLDKLLKEFAAKEKGSIHNELTSVNHK